MKKIISHSFYVISIMFIMALLFICLSMLEKESDNNLWNGGRCRVCNKELEFIGIDREQFYYSCEYNHTIKIHEKK